jgi:hypothetical protein
MQYGRLIPLLILFLFIYLSGCGSDRGAKIAEATPDEYRTISQEFMSELSGVLVSELRKGGPVAAINVCSDTAQYLTKEFSRKKGIVVKRVSFKNRNQYNAPDKFETRVLIEFGKMKAQGRLRALTDYFEIVQHNGKSIARYMKPIVVRPLCLNCHGKEDEIDESVLSIINRNYENDLARNYEVGDLRGAISIKKVLD